MPDAYDWRRWTRAEWNARLFRRYFVSADGPGQLLRRLTLGPEDLAFVAGGAADQIEVQESFEAAMRKDCTGSVLERRLSVAAHEEWAKLLYRRVRGTRAEPPYVADLLLTCYVAGLTDEDTVDVGDFRERLRIVLGHDDGTPKYRLRELGSLWERFARWLAARRAAGAPFHTLRLPADVGTERLIGYSKRLIYPYRKDRLTLVTVLEEAAIDREPPLGDVLRLLLAERGRFSEAFQSTVATAHAAFAGARVDDELDVLWSAVREAAALADAARPQASIRYQVFAPLDEDFRMDLVLMTTGRPRSVGAGLVVRPSGVAYGAFDHLVLQKRDGGADRAGAVACALAGVLKSALPEFGRSVPGRMAPQGVLLFAENANGIRELASHRPSEGRVWALVANRLRAPFEELVTDGGRVPVQGSHHRGWVEVGPFDAALLARLDGQPRSPLAAIRCLQATRVGAAVYLADGVRVEGGYLAMPGALPTVRVGGTSEPIADVVAYALREAEYENERGAVVAMLQREGADAAAFAFPRTDDPPLIGTYEIAVRGTDGEIASRRVTFIAHSAGTEYPGPSDPETWWVEGSAADVTTAAAPEAALPWSAASVSPEAGRTRASRRGARDPRRLGAPAYGPSPVLGSSVIDDHAGMERFVEWAAAVALTRRGIPESDLLDVLTSTLGRYDWRMRWDVLRAWAECGAFDPMTRRTWRGRVWFARSPRLVLVRDGIDTTVALTGLVNWSMRRRAARAFASHGGEHVPPLTLSPDVVAPMMWRIGEREVVDRVARALGLPPATALAPVGALAHRVATVAERTITDCPTAGERLRQWDWKHGHFSVTPAESALPVRVEEWVRPNGPTYFLVDAGARSWWTPSRTWALLCAYVWAGQRSYTASGDRFLCRSVVGGMHLPLPLARALVLSSGIASGPVAQADGRIAYAYAAPDGRTRDAVLETLWREETLKETEPGPELRWLVVAVAEHAACAGGPGDRTVDIGETCPLPPALHRSMVTLGYHAEARLLASRGIPAFLLPHLTTIIRKASAG